MSRQIKPRPFTQVFWVSAARLLIANALVMVIAVYWHWNPLEIILLYIVQAVIIGITQRLKIRDMIEYASRSREIKYSYNPLMTAEAHNVFAVLYGLFSIPIIIATIVKFLIQTNISIPVLPLFLGSLLFVVVHWWSYQSNRQTDRLRPADLNNAYILPLVRLIPLFVALIGVNAEFVYDSSTMLIWMLIKTMVDVGIHIHEHKTK